MDGHSHGMVHRALDRLSGPRAPILLHFHTVRPKEPPLNPSPAFRRTALAAYIAAVLGVTLAPLSSDMYAAITISDKAIHAALFGGMAVLLSWNLNSSGWPRLARILGVTAVFAAAIELVQGVLPFRSGDEWDFLAGVTGAVVCAIPVVLLHTLRRERPEATR